MNDKYIFCYYIYEKHSRQKLTGVIIGGNNLNPK